MDPLGLELENFDALGVWRTTEHGLPIDPSGELDRVPFVGAKELGRMLAARPDFGECVARQFYRHGMGHLESRGEEPAIRSLQASLIRSQYRFSALLTELALSEAFRRPGAIE
jgi:hypothetical protein